jgi:hypothetical protein
MSTLDRMDFEALGRELIAFRRDFHKYAESAWTEYRTTARIISELEKLVESGVSVVVCSQCLYEKSDMTTYEVGRRALEKGVIPGGDITSGAAVTKMMWALAHCSTPEEVADIFSVSLAGEYTIDRI